MRVKVLGSSSKGNCYLLESAAGKLLLECGIKFKDIQEGVGYKFTDILGCLLTHEHNDHKKSYKELLDKGVKIFTSQGTKMSLDVKYDFTVQVVKANEQFKIGDFIILPFETNHDVIEPLGYLIYDTISKEKLLFATDTYYLKNRFKDVNYYLIECNYSLQTLKQNTYYGKLDKSRYIRTLKSHMSLETLIDFFRVADLKSTQEIVLVHLSDQNSDAKMMQETIEKITHVKTSIADTGQVYELSKEPF